MVMFILYYLYSSTTSAQCIIDDDISGIGKGIPGVPGSL